MNLIILHGLPGVGKLTVGKELQKLSDYKLFHNHLTVDLVLSLFEFGSEGFVNLRDEIWINSMEKAAGSDLGGVIFTFAMEATVPEDFISRLANSVIQKNGKVLLVGLTCDEPSLKNRIESPDRSKYGKLNSWERYHEIKELGGIMPLIPPPNLPQITIDNSSLSPQESAQEIWDWLSNW